MILNRLKRDVTELLVPHPEETEGVVRLFCCTSPLSHILHSRHPTEVRHQSLPLGYT